MAPTTLDQPLRLADSTGGSGTSLLTTKGDLLGYDTVPDRVPVGADDLVVTADSTAPLGLSYKAPTPLTTKGDILTFDTSVARLGVGPDTYVITADSTQAKGIKWAPGSGSLTVTDGSTTLTGVTELNCTSGIAVSSGGAGIADLAASGGGGGGGNVTADTHPATADPADDEFEGGALDTAGTRFAGATAWAWSNQGTSTATLANGSLLFLAQADSQIHFILQVAPSPSWRYHLKVHSFAPGTPAGSVYGFAVYGSGSTKNYLFGQDCSDGKLRIHRFTGTGTYDSSPYTGIPFGIAPFAPVYLEIENDGTSLYFRASTTGIDGSFVQVFTQALSTWVTSVTNIGVMGLCSDAGAGGVIDWDRRIA